MVATPLMRVLTGRAALIVDGVPTEMLAADATHGVDQPIGTATITIPASIPEHVTRNAVVEVQAGFTETGGLVRRFSGRVVSRHVQYSRSGRSAQVSCVGWASLLAWPDQADLVYYNASRLWAIFRSLCVRRGVPAFQADYVRYPDGVTDIRLGGEEFVDEGNVIIKRLTSPLDWLTQKARLFGYRVFDTPAGVLTLQRISGIPPAATVVHVEGVNPIEASHDDTLETMATYVEVKGASFTDADGVNVQIRSIPATVPPNPELQPPGYRYIGISDDSLVTQQLADGARNVAEIDLGAPFQTESYRISADTTLAPGAAVHLASGTLGVDGDRWLVTLREAFSKDGYWATVDTWIGGDTALPAGNDAITIPVATGPVHLGDEYLYNYAHPSPQGHVYKFTITVPDDYTAIVLTFKSHGCNSYMLDGANSDSSVSQVQVWQGNDDKPVGSTNLPVQPENFDQFLNYTNLAHWASSRMPIPGQLKAGTAQVWIVSGEDSRLPDDTKFDDFELRDIALTLTGVGTPVLPGEQQ